MSQNDTIHPQLMAVIEGQSLVASGSDRTQLRQAIAKMIQGAQRSVIINCECVERLEPWFNSSYQVYLRNRPLPFTMSRRLAKQFRARVGV